MTEKLTALRTLGQSLWYDNIARDLLDSGEIQALIERGVLGMTSNPSIFMKAITGGTAYDDQLRELAQAGHSTVDIYEHLVVSDITRAADLLAPIYRETRGTDGYVSLEVSPLLAHQQAETLAEVKRLAKWVDRPNLMVKIPATPEGLPTIEEAIASGYNINVTLIFSLDVYRQVMEAYLAGLERRVKAGQPVDGIASVASFFVSRIDTLVDTLLEEKITVGDEDGQLAALKGTAAIDSARLAYQAFKEVFHSDRFKALAEKGAKVQRPLWASTSTKNPAYSDVRYVEELIGPDTVNTAPPHTIEAFENHGEAALTLENDLAGAQRRMAALAAVGIDLDAVTDELLKRGVKAFADAFEKLLAAIEEKRTRFAEAGVE